VSCRALWSLTSAIVMSGHLPSGESVDRACRTAGWSAAGRGWLSRGVQRVAEGSPGVGGVLGHRGLRHATLIALIRWVACAAVIATVVLSVPGNTSRTWPRLRMTITVAACPSNPSKEKTAQSDWFWLQTPASPLGPRNAIRAVPSGRGRAVGREDVDVTQRGVTPGASVKGDSLDRNEMPLPGVGVDQRQDKGRASHRAPALGWRIIMVMLASPRSPRGGCQDSRKTSYHYHICCVSSEYHLAYQGNIVSISFGV
jgi:hypothetical protein